MGRFNTLADSSKMCNMGKKNCIAALQSVRPTNWDAAARLTDEGSCSASRVTLAIRKRDSRRLDGRCISALSTRSYLGQYARALAPNCRTTLPYCHASDVAPAAADSVPQELLLVFWQFCATMSGA